MVTTRDLTTLLRQNLHHKPIHHRHAMTNPGMTKSCLHPMICIHNPISVNDIMGGWYHWHKGIFLVNFLRMFLSLDLLSEYRIQHGAIGHLYVTSSYSTWVFCRGVSGFATDSSCNVWCRGLTTCLLHVGPPFGNRFLNNSWVVGLI